MEAGLIGKLEDSDLENKRLIPSGILVFGVKIEVASLYL